MSILINMEMPTRCFACPMCEVENAEVNCAISHGSYIEYREVDPKVAIQERPSWCSLVEVPPHGRLIDENAIKAWFDEWYDPNVEILVWQLIDEIKNVPTVIEASEVE